MPQAPANGSSKVRFGPFEANLLTGELLSSGKRIRVPAQSFQVLQMLLDHPGDLVTREQLRSLLWPSDTFVDFEHGLNATVNRLREALHDSADRPRWIETLPKRGYRFIGTIEPPAEPTAVPVTAPARPEAPARDGPLTRSWKTAAWAVGVSLSIIAILAGYYLRSRSEASEVTLSPVPFTSYPGVETSPAFSPEGSRIAFAWNGDPASGGKGFDLYVKAIGSETLLRLTHHPSEWISPVWSPDGTQIAFHRIAGTDTGLYVVPALGGLERKLRSTHVPYALAAQINWSPDGKWISFNDSLPERPGDHMFLLSTENLDVTPVPHNPKCLAEANLSFSRTPNDFLYLCVHNLSKFEVYSLSGLVGPSRVVTKFTDFPNGLAWSPGSNRLVIGELTEREPQLVEFSIPGGSPRRLLGAQGVWPALSAQGDKLAYSLFDNRVNIWRKDLLRPDLPAIKLITSTRHQGSAQFSPDGKHIAFTSNRAGPRNIWMQDSDGNNLVRITDLPVDVNGIHWSPDGKQLAFDFRRSGQTEIDIVDISERVPRKLATNVSQISSPSWSRDGKWIYLRSIDSVGYKFYRCPSRGGDALPIITLPDGANVIESFDGHSLYFSRRIANTTLAVLPLDGASAPSDVPGIPALGNAGMWTLVPNGIYFVPHDEPRSLYYYDFFTGSASRIFVIEKDFADGLSISPDGRYILYAQMDEENSDIMLVDHFN